MLGGEQVRRLEDGPYGGAELTLGDTPSGEILDAPYQADGSVWGGVRVSDCSLAQTAYALSDSRLWLPGSARALELDMKPLDDIGELGLVHRDIIGPAPRGPFDKTTPSPTATYPALWNHNAKNETRMVCAPDSQLRVRQGMEEKAADVWATASRSHLNLEYTFGSQPLAVAFTEQESIGGRVWPNVIFDDKRFDYAFVVWGSSTLGLLCYWWHSTRQQSSKATITIRSAESLPVLDLHAPGRRPTGQSPRHLRRIQGQRTQARLHRGRRPEPRPPGQARRLRPAGVRPGHLPGRPPPLRQMVRRAVGAWRQAQAERVGAGNLDHVSTR